MKESVKNKRQTRVHIGGWVSPKPAQEVGGEDFCTVAQYKLMKESGIRTAYAIYERSAVDVDGKNANERALACAEKAGMQFYVWDTKVRDLMLEGDETAVKEYLKKYTKFKSFKGVLMKDEPTKEDLVWCKKIVDVWDKYLPDKDCFMNLFPEHVLKEDCKLAQDDTFEDDYLNAFMAMNVKRLSYDLYPLMYDDDGKPTIQKHYLHNLELCAEVAKKKGVPLWTFIQSMSFTRWHRRPDESALRWQIMSGFAYGVKGIQHFCYWPPTEDKLLTVNDAFLNPQGEPTDIYFTAQKIHKEIETFEKEFVTYDYEGVMPILGDGAKENAFYETLNCPLKSHALIRSVSATQDTLLGVLKNEKGKNAFFLANFADPILQLSSEVKLCLNGVEKIKVSQNGKTRRIKAKDGMFTFVLGAGDGAFIQIIK
ncbi:MAG: hypothetical protein E7368_00115 [Clostridiales bacterium]|nr:hypothetical protein [Clostridiales bacterium]